MVGVAQLVRAPDCGSGGRGFKSPRSPHLLGPCVDDVYVDCTRTLRLSYPLFAPSNYHNPSPSMAYCHPCSDKTVGNTWDYFAWIPINERFFLTFSGLSGVFMVK